MKSCFEVELRSNFYLHPKALRFNQNTTFRCVCFVSFALQENYLRIFVFSNQYFKKKTLHETYDYRYRHNMCTTLLLQLQPPHIISLVFVLATFTSCFYYCALPTTYSFGQQVVSEEQRMCMYEWDDGFFSWNLWKKRWNCASFSCGFLMKSSTKIKVSSKYRPFYNNPA